MLLASTHQTRPLDPVMAGSPRLGMVLTAGQGTISAPRANNVPRGRWKLRMRAGGGNACWPIWGTTPGKQLPQRCSPRLVDGVDVSCRADIHCRRACPQCTHHCHCQLTRTQPHAQTTKSTVRPSYTMKLRANNHCCKKYSLTRGYNQGMHSQQLTDAIGISSALLTSTPHALRSPAVGTFC